MLKRYHCIVAGGAITSLFTNREINDIDVYFKGKKDLGEFLYEEMQGNWVIAHTDKALLFMYDKAKIQAIYFKYFETANEIFDTFDYTVCMGAFDFDTEEFILHKEFLKHNASKILKFNANTAFPIISALRIDKYKNKGYSISKAEFLRVMLTLLQAKIDNYESFKNQIGGMYGENYDNLLEPKDQEDFSIATMVEKMRYLNLDKDYFVLPKENEIKDWDEFVYGIVGEKIKYFEHNNKQYRLIRGELQRLYKNIDDKYIKVSASDVVKFPMTRYKYVRKCEDGTLRSFYDNSFIWKIGENIPKNDAMGLYAVQSSSLRNCSYCSEKNRVLIELLVLSIDDVFKIENILDGTCQYRKLYATRVVPEDEAEKLTQSNYVDDPWNY